MRAPTYVAKIITVYLRHSDLMGEAGAVGKTYAVACPWFGVEARRRLPHGGMSFANSNATSPRNQIPDFASSKGNTMSIANLEDLFLHELKDVLDAERQILKALPKMAKAAESDQLRAAFEEHHSVTEKQVERLETIFKSLDKAARGKHCAGMEGILKEGEELFKEEDRGAPLDAAMICAAQKVEHYEIAVYGTLAEWAKLLGMDEAVELLTETLGEEKETDEKLSALASEINLVAEHEPAE